ncbi:MAG: type II toxin-antitoxin system prevent-host-death family antitoxin [Alphaproteobacteria bacterium]
MDVLPYTHVRQNLARVMEGVCDERVPIIVSRQSARPVVMMSLDEYHAIEETLHLLRSPRNAARLLESVAEAEAGGAAPHGLVDES